MTLMAWFNADTFTQTDARFISKANGAAENQHDWMLSTVLDGGTGEIRAWISVAAACGRAARVVEYLASHHAKAGLGFAYWPWDEAD